MTEILEIAIVAKTHSYLHS